MHKKTLYLIDGTSLCYRSFFALRLSTSAGLPTGAVYGVYQALKKIIAKYSPEYIGVCFDVSRKTFRQEKFKEYKINRPPAPDGLKTQIPMVKDLVEAMGVKIIEKEGFEADDVIASLSAKAVKDDLSVVIVSSDKDLYQLIKDGKVSVYNYHKDEFLGQKEFIKEYGFEPELIVDYLSLAGDSTDNIPGAKGIGKKGAAKLIKEFGSIENVFNNLDKLPEKLKSILTENKKMVTLSRELVELCSCPLDLSWQDLKISEADTGRLYKMFSKFEFKALLKSIPAPSLKLDVKVEQGIDKDFLKSQAGRPLIFFAQEQKAFVFNPQKECIYRASFDDLKEIFQGGCLKVTWGLKEQLSYLKSLKAKGPWFDIKIAAHLLSSDLSDYSLSGLAARYLEKHFGDIPDNAAPYFISRLYDKLSVKVKEAGLSSLFTEIEMPLVDVLRGMQDNGVKVDVETLESLLQKVDKRTESAKKDIFKAAGKEFNLNSPKQLSKVLFEDLKIPPVKKTKTGYSTNEEVLEKLSAEHDIARFILDYRQLNKLKTTYIAPLAEDVKKNKGFLHTQFNQVATQTGRLSSSSPNLQSIPAKGEFSSWLRRAFVPSFDNGYILCGDYSQIELRILAHLSKDPNLAEAFNRDEDIHSFTAGLLFGQDSSKVDEQQRNLAKKVNFGIVYGMSAYGLSKELKISPVEAQNFIDDYFRRYPKVKEYIDKTCLEAEDKGFVKTILGRMRQLPEINSSNPGLKDFARRQAINAPIQGSCADLIKKAMVSIAAQIKKRKLKTKLTIQIHDELVFDIPEDELKEVKTLVKEGMEQSIKLDVPVKVNIKCGRNWGDVE